MIHMALRLIYQMFSKLPGWIVLRPGLTVRPRSISWFCATSPLCFDEARRPPTTWTDR
jgi:hypothetical protein